MEKPLIRKATIDDADTLAIFNAEMARETEGKTLLPQVIGAGVRALLKDPGLGYYVVAEVDGQVIASLMVTTEWSDWRNGIFWWIQSVYVQTMHRRRGIYRSLYTFVKQLAANDPSVCGFRLYVERENSNAQSTYKALGMQETGYKLFEELKPSTRYCK